MGRKPFGIKHVERFPKLEPVNTLARQQARKRRDETRKVWGQHISPSQNSSGPPEKSWLAERDDSRPSQSALRRSEKSQDSKKGIRRLPRGSKHTVGSQITTEKESLIWRSIMPCNTIETIDGRGQSLPKDQSPNRPDRHNRPNTINITITPQPGGGGLDAQEKGNLKKAAARNSGYEVRAIPQRVREGINRQVELTATGMIPISTLRTSPPSRQSPDYTTPPKPSATGLDTGDFLGSAVAIGPAELVRKLLAEDPILKEAELLSKKRTKSTFFSQSFSKFDTHAEPRFRVLPTWLQRKNTKELGSLGGAQTPSVGTETEAQQEQNQERQVGIHSSQHETVNPISCSEMEVTTLASEVTPSNDVGRTASDEGIEPMKPLQPERSIFEQLFSEERPRGDNFWRIANRLKAAFSAVEKDPISDSNLEGEAPVWRPQPGQSIFGQLFPEEVESRPGHSEEGWRRPMEPLTPPKDSLLISLRNEVRSWIPEGQQGQITGPQPGEYGSHSTVVVISGTSPSLTDTDFYRIAPEGRHVEGWAGGLVKVVQARDSVTFEPLGQYYLMFYSRPSALAYVDKVNRLHALSRKLLHAPAASGKEVAKGALDQAPAAPQPYLTDEEQAAVRSFTLLSPSLPPKISVRLWNTQLVADIAAKSNIADVVQALRPEATTPAKVLLKLNPSPDGGGGSGAGASDPGGLTTDELWLTLRDDGRERSAPWVLASLSRGIMPVKSRFTAAQSGIKVKAAPVPVHLDLDADDVYDDESGEPVAGQLPPASEQSGERLGGGADRHVRFSRFILTFTQPAIARRFVRCWHKRAIYDAVLERTVVVDAVALM